MFFTHSVILFDSNRKYSLTNCKTPHKVGYFYFLNILSYVLYCGALVLRLQLLKTVQLPTSFRLYQKLSSTLKCWLHHWLQWIILHKIKKLNWIWLSWVTSGRKGGRYVVKVFFNHTIYHLGKIIYNLVNL